MSKEKSTLKYVLNLLSFYSNDYIIAKEVFVVNDNKNSIHYTSKDVNTIYGLATEFSLIFYSIDDLKKFCNDSFSNQDLYKTFQVKNKNNLYTIGRFNNFDLEEYYFLSYNNKLVYDYLKYDSNSDDCELCDNKILNMLLMCKAVMNNSMETDDGKVYYVVENDKLIIETTYYVVENDKLPRHYIDKKEYSLSDLNEKIKSLEYEILKTKAYLFDHLTCDNNDHHYSNLEFLQDELESFNCMETYLSYALDEKS